MSERYWITGVQLGMIKGILYSDKDFVHIHEQIDDILDEIIDKQFIGNVKKEGK